MDKTDKIIIGMNVLSVLFVVTGIALISIPAAFIACGILIFLYACFLAWARKQF